MREAGLSYARGGREMETLIRERGESLGDPFAGAHASRMVLDEQFELVRRQPWPRRFAPPTESVPPSAS